MNTRLVITAGAVLLVLVILTLNFQWAWQRDRELIANSQTGLLLGSMHTIEVLLQQPGTQIDSSFHIKVLESLGRQSHITSAQIINSKGFTLNSTNPGEIGESWNQKQTRLPNIETIPDRYTFQTFNDSDTTLTGMQSLCSENNTACDLLYLEVDIGDILAQGRSELIVNLLIFGLAIGVCATFILMMLNRRVFQPANKIIADIDKFASGDHNIRCSASGAWELRKLVRSVNDLFDHIQLSEKSLLEKRTMYAALLETMGDGLITMQPDGSIESMNGAAERLLGFPRRELAGKNISAIFANGEIDTANFSLQRYIEAKSGDKHDHHWEVRMQHKKGGNVPVRMSISNMVIDDNNIYICVLSDIADIKEMEEELRELNVQLSQTNQKLEQSVITDSLTGLYNRRHFDNTFSKELARATRQSTALSLLIVDIDFFKQYNDRYGHLLGDDCLSRVGECMSNLFKRSGDLPARYGGEEFAVVLPGCDVVELHERAETLRCTIEELGMPHAGSDVSEVLTVSIGAVSYKPASESVVAPKPREIFKEADKALYRAKEKGRNCVEFAGLFNASPMLPNSNQFAGQTVPQQIS